MESEIEESGGSGDLAEYKRIKGLKIFFQKMSMGLETGHAVIRQGSTLPAAAALQAAGGASTRCRSS